MLFVIDGSARDRLQDADDLLTSLLMEKELHGIPMVFLANKKDIEGTVHFFSCYNSGLKKQFPVVFSVIMLNQIS